MEELRLSAIFDDEHRLNEFVESIIGAFPPTIKTICNDPHSPLFVSATYEEVGASDDTPGFTSYWREVVVTAKGESLTWTDWGHEKATDPGNFHYEGTGEVQLCDAI